MDSLDILRVLGIMNRTRPDYFWAVALTHGLIAGITISPEDLNKHGLFPEHPTGVEVTSLEMGLDYLSRQGVTPEDLLSLTSTSQPAGTRLRQQATLPETTGSPN